MSILKFFSRKGKKSGLVMLAGNMIKKETDSRIDGMIDDLKRDILASRTPYGVPGDLSPEEKTQREKERIRKERQRRPSTVEAKMMDIAQEKKYFQTNLQDWEIEKIYRNRDYRKRMQLKDYIELHDVVTNYQVRNMYDLDRLDDQARKVILDRIIDLKTFNKVVNKCWAITDIPVKRGIVRDQYIASRLDTVIK